MIIASQLVAKVSVEGVTQAESDLKRVSDQTHKTTASFDMLKNAVSFAGGMLITQGLGFLKDQLGSVFTESLNAQAGMAQTVQVLKSTRDASGMTASAIADLATQYSHLTKFSDDTVQAGENMLLTFTNIGKNVFPLATQTVLDMSQALGQDATSSAMQLGKALNDPVMGMSALQRVGVTFSATQKDQIKQFMGTNQLAKAQGVILQELQKEFGGSAVAAGKTFGGQMAILNQRLDDVRQNIGDALMPIVTQFVGYISTAVLPRLNDFSTWFTKQGVPAIQQFGQWFQQNMVPALQQFGQKLLDVATAGVHFVQWLHDASPGAQALEKAAIALAVAIAAIKIAGLVGDMRNFIASAPQMAAKLFLVQESAEGVAGAKGLGAIATEAGTAEKAIATASSGMKLSLAGVLGSIALVATAEMGIAMWLRDNNIVPKAGMDQPDWITHVNRDALNAQALQKAAKDAKALADELLIARHDMEDLYDKFGPSRGHILGDLFDAIGQSVNASDMKVITLKSHLDDLEKPFVLHLLTPDIIATRLKFIELKTHIDDLEGPTSIGILTPDVIAARLKVIEFKSRIDDLKGPISVGVVTPAVDAAQLKVIILKSHLDDLKGTFSPTVGTRSIDAAIASAMYLKSKLDDLAAPVYVGVGGPIGHYATGISNNPVGHWAIVGERGPEAMYVPRGASILPSGTPPPSSQGGYASPSVININLAGHRVAQVLMPHIVREIRTATGVKL